MALRLSAAVGALGAGAAAAVLVLVLLASTPGPTSTVAGRNEPTPNGPAPARSAPALPRVPAGFPAPPPGAVVFSREAGADALALGIVRRGPRLVLQASILDGQGHGARGLAVSIELGGSTVRAAPCGPGCYRAAFATPGPPRGVVVDVRGAGATTHWEVPLPAAWPPRSAAALVARATSAWRSLTSLAYVDRLASGPGQLVVSTWRIEAPNRVAYEVRGGYRAVIIGGRRWDRAPGGRWIESAQSVPLQQPVPFWVAATDAHVLGARSLAGRPVWDVSFFDPGTPAWFEVALDRRTLRTLELHMITTAHFMHDSYGSFDEPLGIRPPR